jgi:hypothetical protein
MPISRWLHRLTMPGGRGQHGNARHFARGNPRRLRRRHRLATNAPIRGTIDMESPGCGKPEEVKSFLPIPDARGCIYGHEPLPVRIPTVFRINQREAQPPVCLTGRDPRTEARLTLSSSYLRPLFTNCRKPASPRASRRHRVMGTIKWKLRQSYFACQRTAA